MVDGAITVSAQSRKLSSCWLEIEREVINKRRNLADEIEHKEVCLIEELKFSLMPISANLGVEDSYRRRFHYCLN